MKLEVFDPTGASEISELYAPRLANLKGKTICEIRTSDWESDRTFPFIRQLLQRRFPDIKIIPYTELLRTGEVTADVFSRLLKEKGCDGAIVGNAA